MNSPRICFVLSLTFLFVNATNMNLNRNVKVISSMDTPCSTIEISTPVHFSRAVRPLEIELDLSLNATSLYENVYGKGAADSATHKSHFECHANHIEALDGVSESVFQNLKEAILLRTTDFETKRGTRSAAALPIIMSVASLVGKFHDELLVGVL